MNGFSHSERDLYVSIVRKNCVENMIDLLDGAAKLGLLPFSSAALNVRLPSPPPPQFLFSHFSLFFFLRTNVKYFFSSACTLQAKQKNNTIFLCFNHFFLPNIFSPTLEQT
jgi:hypothetical protein